MSCLLLGNVGRGNSKAPPYHPDGGSKIEPNEVKNLYPEESNHLTNLHFSSTTLPMSRSSQINLDHPLMKRDRVSANGSRSECSELASAEDLWILR